MFHQSAVLHILTVSTHARFVKALAEGAEGATCKQHDAFELLVEKEVVEAPDGSILPEWIGHEVWVVGVDVALHQVDLAVQSQPQLVVNFAVLGGRGNAQQVVNVVCDELEINCQHSKIKYKEKINRINII